MEPGSIKHKKSLSLAALASKEWIITNGIGGYASSTVPGLNTRRYHGLLVASFNPPTERLVLVSKVDETIYYNRKDHPLSTNRYVPGIVHPHGFTLLCTFDRVPLPKTVFNTAGISLEKTVFMVYGSNTTVVEYRNTSARPYLIKLNPFFVHRDYHGLQHEQPNYDFQVKYKSGARIINAYYGAEPLAFRFTEGNFIANRYWNKNLDYEIEKERGQHHVEDSYSLGHVEHVLQPGKVVYLLFSTDEKMVLEDPLKLKEAELKRIAAIAPPGIPDGFLRDLIISGEQFIVQRRTTDNYSVIAGYHWFTDWGRDAMIAIRGLCIATGRQEIARSVITTFLDYMKEGIIPNRFPDYKGDMAEYNTADATLWLFVAIYEYDQAFNDLAFLREVLPRLVQIIEHHIRGTMHNIHVTEKGFLYQGSKNIQLTWMDARINDVVFTPRSGCAVEINALWYNALRICEYAAERTGYSLNPEINALRKKFQDNFLRSFWNRDGYLNDVITPDRKADTAVRPNQVYALSLPFRILPLPEEKFVLETIRKKLFTVYGLRTLDPLHPEFKKEYAGGLWERDAAYHQGTVWPFLLPEYYIAFLKVNNFSSAAKKEVAANLRALKAHFYKEDCIHGVSEIFDGLNPVVGKGCIHQAWSVSNLILLIIKAGLKI